MSQMVHRGGFSLRLFGLLIVALQVKWAVSTAMTGFTVVLSNYMEYETASSLTFDFVITTALTTVASDTITIKADTAVWSASPGADGDCTFSFGSPLSADGAKTLAVDANLQDMVITPGADVTAGDAGQLVCTTNLAANPATGTTVSWTVESTQDTTPSSASTWTIVGSDPITIYKGKKSKFWLPFQTFSPLMRTPDLTVLASPLQGPSEDLQWFGKFVVTLPNGVPVVKINVRRDHNMTSSKRRRGDVKYMDITLSRDKSPLDTSKLGYEHNLVMGGVKLIIGSRPHVTAHSLLMQQEYLYIQTKSVSLTFLTSHAGNEFSHDMQSAMEYLHLDMVIMDMQGEHHWTGILPELWGVRDISDAVEAMKLAPSATRQAREDRHACSSGKGEREMCLNFNARALRD